MLVRAGNNGEWLQLRPVEGIPSGGFRSLCDSDAANLLELDAPLPVVAFGPWPAGSGHGIDAVCLTPDGGIELLVGTWGEAPRDTLWRLLDAAGTLRGSSLEAFASHCTELGNERSVTRWLHQRVGGDAARLEANLRTALETGDFGFVLVTSSGAGDLAQPLQFLQQRGAAVRVFEVEVLRAGDVQAIEGIEVPLVADGEHATVTPRSVRQAPELTAVPDLAPDGQTAVPDPAHEPELESEPASEPEPEPEPEMPDAAAAPAADEAPVAVELPSDETSFLSAVDRLDHRTSTHLRWLHGALHRLVDELEYTTDGSAQHVVGWLHGSVREPLFGLDSLGVLQLVLSSLPEHEQLEYAQEVAGMLPDADGELLLAEGFVDIDVPAHLDDQTLLEYLVDNLVEAMPGGREAFGTGAPDPEAKTDVDVDAQVEAEVDVELELEADVDTDSAGDDYFAGVSGGHDPAEPVADHAKDAAAALTSPSDEQQGNDQLDWADRRGDQKASGSRWLRRRGAA